MAMQEPLQVSVALLRLSNPDSAAEGGR